MNFPAGDDPSSVAVGDFNGDGKPDLAVANGFSNNVSVLEGNGNGTFQTAVNYAVGSEPNSVAIEDFNGDGIPDLVVANTASNNVSVLIGNGNETFQDGGDYPVEPSRNPWRWEISTATARRIWLWPTLAAIT